jgi:AbrB family looped-hinge helix DNA binding protein
MMKTVVSNKGQIVLPAEFRRLDDVKPGQQFDIERIDRGEYRLTRRGTPPNEGLVDWLLSCPIKGFFVSANSDSTDFL